MKVRLAYKVNMGNYENLDVEFELDADARPGETVDSAFDRVFAKVEEKLTTKVGEIKVALGE